MDQENKNICTIYLVRHGETEWNKNEIVMGHLDSPLTEDGIKQVETVARELESVIFDAIFSSDLGRARRTAEIIKLERQLAVQTSKALRERTSGSWEGKTMAEYKKNFQHLFEKMEQLSEEEKKDFKFAEDFESDGQLIARFVTQLREIAIAYPNKTVLVVSHGGSIRSFLAHADPARYGTLPIGSFLNAGYARIITNGIDFFIQKVKGIKEQAVDGRSRGAD